MSSHKVLSIQFGGHDTSAALMIDGNLVAACEQERYSLDKHSQNFPMDAINDCLKIGGIAVDALDEIALTMDADRWVRETYLRPALQSSERITFLINDIERIHTAYDTEARVRQETGFTGEIVRYRHHLCHVASAYYPSGFDDSLLVSYDGAGEHDTGVIAVGRNGKIEIIDDSNRYPDSLGLLYSAITYYLGWAHHCDEGIIMGLAPYGDSSSSIPGSSSSYLDIFRDILRETGDYSFEVGCQWIAYHRKRDTWIGDQFIEMFGPKRAYDDAITQHHCNIVAGLQDRLEEVVVAQLQRARDNLGLNKLCIAGGVGLNCSMNGRIASEKIFDEIFVQPASGDAGVTIGACFLSHERRFGLKPSLNHNFYLGSRATDQDFEDALTKAGVSFHRSQDIFSETAANLADGKIIGWLSGPAEFGPRALGNRSILTRPYPIEMKDHLNIRVKFREEFRPFAPAVLAEKASDYFQIDQESPHMLIAVDVMPEKLDEIPAVVHVDNSCRVQTVRESNNPRFRKLLEAFYLATGCPVLLNTSFNVKGQPIINTPEQAVACFLSTNIDVLVLGDFCAIK